MKIILLFICLITSSCLLKGQEYKTIEVESNLLLNISPDVAWTAVQDWSQLHKLVPAIVDSTITYGSGVNSTWYIHLKNGAVIKEKMTYHDDTHRTMSYIMEETPMPIEDYLAIIKIDSYGISKSLVSFYTTCRVITEKETDILNTFKSFQETYISNLEKIER